MKFYRIKNIYEKNRIYVENFYNDIKSVGLVWILTTAEDKLQHHFL